MIVLRAKLVVSSIQKSESGQEDWVLNAVGPNEADPENEADENNTFAKFTPSAEFKISVMDPALWGKFKDGDAFYIDFKPAAE